MACSWRAGCGPATYRGLSRARARPGISWRLLHERRPAARRRSYRRPGGGEGIPSLAGRGGEGAHAEGEGAPVRRRRQRFVRLAGAAACATLAVMLAAMPPCPARAQTNGSGATGGVRVGGPIVQPPRAFGYQLGDLVTQRLLLPA